ncbi:MAG TPA: SDR family NAD(P)-dependent oxidoreductase [Verrucomicrobiae bacterium]|nr:SDR family NAD(P)-dependent oxidoreductase [Verrucomicrobiae bacterium]
MNRIAVLTAALAVGAVAGIALGKPRKQFSFRGRSVIITGGSRGLGLELARQLAMQRARLTLIARDLLELKRAERELKGLGAEVLTVPCDVRQQREVVEAVTRTVTEMGRVDVLINNAGIIQVGPMDEMSLEDFEDAMAVHFFGPLYFTLAALPHMKASGGGRIVNISSIGGKIAVPHLLPYTASKFALAGFSDGLRAELKQKNIHVTTVCPGLMRTGSPRNAVIKGKYRQEYAWFSISSSLPLLSTSVESAAAKIIEGCRRGRSRVLIGAHTRFALLLNEIAPAAAAKLSSIINHLLPGQDSGAGAPKMGYESHSKWSPSWLTHLNDRAAWKNNEILIRS